MLTPVFGDFQPIASDDVADIITDLALSAPIKQLFLAISAFSALIVAAISQEALSELLASHGMRAIAFGSAGDYVRADKPDLPACLILDVELPDINGLDLQRQIAEGDHPAIVFLS